MPHSSSGPSESTKTRPTRINQPKNCETIKQPFNSKSIQDKRQDGKEIAVSTSPMNSRSNRIPAANDVDQTEKVQNKKVKISSEPLFSPMHCDSASTSDGSWRKRLRESFVSTREKLRSAALFHSSLDGPSLALRRTAHSVGAIEMLAERSLSINQQSLHIRSNSARLEKCQSQDSTQSAKSAEQKSTVASPSKKLAHHEGGKKKKSEKKASKKMDDATNKEGLKELMHTISKTASSANYGIDKRSSLKNSGSASMNPSKSQSPPSLELILDSDGSLVCTNMLDITDIISGLEEYERRFRQESLSPFANVVPHLFHKKSPSVTQAIPEEPQTPSGVEREEDSFPQPVSSQCHSPCLDESKSLTPSKTHSSISINSSEKKRVTFEKTSHHSASPSSCTDHSFVS